MQPPVEILTVSSEAIDVRNFISFGGKESGTTINFPALLEGTIIIPKTQGVGKSIGIIMENYVLKFDFVADGEFLVKESSNVQLGEPIFTVTYKQGSAMQKRFSNFFGGSDMPSAIIGISYAELDTSGHFKWQEISPEKNFLGGHNKEILIPTLIKSKTS